MLDPSSLCQKCGKNPAIGLAIIGEDISPICGECRSQLLNQVDSALGLSKNIMPLDLLKILFSVGSKSISTKAPCPKCGWSWKDFVEKQRLSCSYDYQHFSEELIPVLGKFQGSSHHVGKIPLSSIKLEEAQKALQKSIEEEKYEDAAKWRDLIKVIQQRISS